LSFVDTNVFVAALNKRDKHHDRGRRLLEKAFLTFDWLYTSDYILDECLSVAWARTKDIELAKRLSLIQQLDKFIEESQKIELLKVNEASFSAAKSYLRKFSKVIPTLTDWTCLVLMRDFGISKILSFDEHFVNAKSIPEFSHITCITDISELK
jgi:predicted nucleic acid-binding protein